MSVTQATEASRRPPTAASMPVGGPGGIGTIPPASVPLTFLAAAGVGLIGFGLAVWFAADNAVVSPNLPGVVAATHVGVLACLTTAVLGAMHQFSPVIGRRALRSVPVARVTAAGIVLTGWVLASGFAHGPEWLVPFGGVIGATTVLLAVWNLSAPLSHPSGSVPIRGLRLSLGFLVATVAFGVVYAFDRQTGWFPLLPHRVLAHAHLGLLGWLGLTYAAVAEKLWPMFLLAHRPTARAGAWAVGLIAAGTPVLALGLLFEVPAAGWLGGVVAGAGLVSHLVSLATAVKHRRRALELLHAYLFTAAGFLVAALVLGAVAGAADVSAATRGRLVAAEVASLLAWLMLAVVGHAHKIVPFISYNALRKKGFHRGPTGAPLVFADLFDRRAARVTLVVGGAGFAAVVLGLITGRAELVAPGGFGIAVTGAIATVNLALGPHRARRAARQEAST